MIEYPERRSARFCRRFLALCGLLFSSMALQAQPQTPVWDTVELHPRLPANAGKDFAYQHFRLPNGLEVVLVPEDRAPVVGMALYVKAGLAHEEDHEWGAQELLVSQLEKLGALGSEARRHYMRLSLEECQYRVESSLDGVGVSLSQPAGHPDYGLWLLSRLLGYTLPNLDTAAIAPWQARLENGLDMRLVTGAFPEEHPYRKHTGDLLPEVQAYRHAQAYIGRRWAPNHAVLVLSGRYDARDVLERCAEYFGPIPGSTAQEAGPPPSFENANDTSSLVRYQDAAGPPRMVMSWSMPPSNNDEAEARRALALLLDDPFQAPLDEEAIAQLGLDSLQVHYQKGRHGDLLWMTAYAPDRIDWKTVAQDIRQEVRLLRRGLLDAQLGRRLQEAVKLAYARQTSTMAGRASQLGRYFLYGVGLDNTPRQYRALRRVSPRLLDNAYASSFGRSGPDISLLHSQYQADSLHAQLAVRLSAGELESLKPPYRLSALLPEAGRAPAQNIAFPPDSMLPRFNNKVWLTSLPYFGTSRLMLRYPYAQLKDGDEGEQPLYQLLKPASRVWLEDKARAMKRAAVVKTEVRAGPDGLTLALETANPQQMGLAMETVFIEEQERQLQGMKAPQLDVSMDRNEEDGQLPERASVLREGYLNWSLREALTDCMPVKAGAFPLSQQMEIAGTVLYQQQPVMALHGALGSLQNPIDQFNGLPGRQIANSMGERKMNTDPRDLLQSMGIEQDDEHLGGFREANMAKALFQPGYLVFQHTSANRPAMTELAFPLSGTAEVKAFAADYAAARHLIGWMAMDHHPWQWQWLSGGKTSYLYGRYTGPENELSEALTSLGNALGTWQEYARAAGLQQVQESAMPRLYHQIEQPQHTLQSGVASSKRAEANKNWLRMLHAQTQDLEDDGWQKAIGKMAHLKESVFFIRGTDVPEGLPGDVKVRTLEPLR